MRPIIAAASAVALALAAVHMAPGFAWVALGFCALAAVLHVYETECAHRERADAHARALALARVKSPAVERVETLAQQVEELQSQVTALRLNRGMQ